MLQSLLKKSLFVRFTTFSFFPLLAKRMIALVLCVCTLSTQSLASTLQRSNGFAGGESYPTPIHLYLGFLRDDPSVHVIIATTDSGRTIRINLSPGEDFSVRVIPRSKVRDGVAVQQTATVRTPEELEMILGPFLSAPIYYSQGAGKKADVLVGHVKAPTKPNIWGFILIVIAFIEILFMDGSEMANGNADEAQGKGSCTNPPPAEVPEVTLPPEPPTEPPMSTEEFNRRLKEADKKVEELYGPDCKTPPKEEQGSKENSDQGSVGEGKENQFSEERK